ncbi:hypothetical protein LSTR_LSTR009739 [Laodelphax striatellus]|uniref:Uncharacterized protein n=1 Tax=Laodelphax striatellus TaxID=195883 RepID=A0A482WVA8_LAOST|nr:hypothetical protein LSTR_LSTR009739 [Laodelphax striatellus]
MLEVEVIEYSSFVVELKDYASSQVKPPRRITLVPMAMVSKSEAGDGVKEPAVQTIQNIYYPEGWPISDVERANARDYCSRLIIEEVVERALKAKTASKIDLEAIWTIE